MSSPSAPSHPSTRLAALTTLFGLLLLPSSLLAQGCLIARGGGGATITDGSGYLEKGDWQVNLAIRHFDSHRHFAGNDEQTHRSDAGTEVYNNSWYLDTTLTYAWSKRLNLSVTLPYVTHDRSSLYEHLGNNSGQRFATQASGLADVSASASYWVIDPDKARRWNLSVGLGIKFATGDDEAKDIFMRSSGPSERFVDSSIQPGDGGTGGVVSLQGFFHLKGNLSAYGNGFYLFNPEERNENTGFSIPDGYMVRGGLEYRIAAVEGLAVSLGARNEGVVAHDLFGGSRGSRRPGFAVSVEPGVTFAKGRYVATMTVPIAVHRNRVTTFGSLRAGDAAFADYTWNFSFSMKL
ncbi:MAG TPA: hypothetical protein VHN79_05880 [Lacunisphaera sp.]|nr:hypothetical protein [Lacunisphaera sp.]